MKKLLSILFAVVLLSLALPVSAAGFETAGVTSVRLSSPQPFTGAVSATDAGALRQAEVFLASAGGVTTIPGGAGEIARIEVTAESGARTFQLLSGGSGYYLAEGAQFRPVAYGDFERLVQAVDGSYDYATKSRSPAKALFYPSAPVPGASYGGYDLAIFQNSYAFKRLNNRFAYRTTAFDMAVPEYPSPEGKLIAPEFYLAPGAVTYTVQKPGEEAVLWSGSASQMAAQTLPDGKYSVLVKADYAGEYYKGTVTYYYTLSAGAAATTSAAAPATQNVPSNSTNPANNIPSNSTTPTASTAPAGSTPPSTAEPAADRIPSNAEAGGVRFSVVADHAAPGEMILLRVTGADPASPIATAVTDLDYKPVFFRQGNGDQIALVPVSVYQAAGRHTVTITSVGKAETLGYTVKEKQFEVQQLTVAPSTAEETILSDKANSEYEAVVAPLRFVADDVKRWAGRFILPTSDEKVTSPFGIIRYVNGGSTPTRHNALDLAVPLDTPVKASGGGRVLYAGFLQLTGNTVIIEHGYGLKSWYYHMNSLNVKTGDVVTQGQQIGAVGSTGFSTGAHMHFGMSVNNVFVNPYTLIQTDLAV